MKNKNLEHYYLICSIDGIEIDYESDLGYRDQEPGFWECYEIAEKAGCTFFHLETTI